MAEKTRNTGSLFSQTPMVKLPSKKVEEVSAPKPQEPVIEAANSAEESPKHAPVAVEEEQPIEKAPVREKKKAERKKSADKAEKEKIVTVSFTIPESIREDLDNAAYANRKNRSEYLVGLIKEDLKKNSERYDVFKSL